MDTLLKYVLCYVLNFAVFAAGSNKDVSVIIIGAGPAGIAAAAKLFENGFTNVTILEAENRIGGRINSVPFRGSILDLGAEWCHGGKGNLIYEMVHNLNLLEYDSYDNVEFYHSSLKQLDYDFIDHTLNVLNERYTGEKGDAETSIGEYILQKFHEMFVENYKHDPNNSALLQDLLDFFKSTVLSWESAFSWYDVAAQTSYQKSEDNSNYLWKGRGYKTILDVLTKKYPNASEELPVYENIIFQKDVVKVFWDRDIPEIECSDNTMYAADHVIWTPSLGVLKHEYMSLFNPALENKKVNAINSIGFGAVSKILYYFPVRWWPEHVNMFAFLWSDEDSKNAWSEFPYGYQIDGKSWVTAIQDFTVNPYNEHILTAWIVGEHVPYFDTLENDVLINGTLFLFEKFLSYKFHNLTKPEKIIREKWYSNEHFRGTYSYDTLEVFAQNFSARDTLAKPLKSANEKPLVLFAGEATNRIHFGTVHGAIESGRREADRIINYYK